MNELTPKRGTEFEIAPINIKGASLSDAYVFKKAIEFLISARISKNWVSMEEIELILENPGFLNTRIVKKGPSVQVSLFNEKNQDDPVVRFAININGPSILNYSSISYLNGCQLSLKSEMNLTSFDIAPEDLNSFFKSWTTTLPRT